jgi:hypothetical protein
VDVTWIATNSSQVVLIAALFQDSGANALATAWQFNANATSGNTINLTYWMTAGTTSATTFKVRGGANSSGTTYFNAHPSFSTGVFGGTLASSITITEYTP